MKQHEDLIKKEIPKELIDQSAHFGSCLGFSLIGAIPILGPLILVWVWAITREFYQHKKDYLEPQENFFQLNFLNLDMMWNWVGILVGASINASIWYLLLREFLWMKAFV